MADRPAKGPYHLPADLARNGCKRLRIRFRIVLLAFRRCMQSRLGGLSVAAIARSPCAVLGSALSGMREHGIPSALLVDEASLSPSLDAAHIYAIFTSN